MEKETKRYLSKGEKKKVLRVVRSAVAKDPDIKPPALAALIEKRLGITLKPNTARLWKKRAEAEPAAEEQTEAAAAPSAGSYQLYEVEGGFQVTVDVITDFARANRIIREAIDACAANEAG